MGAGRSGERNGSRAADDDGPGRGIVGASARAGPTLRDSVPGSPGTYDHPAGSGRRARPARELAPPRPDERTHRRRSSG
ncbi:hypothetical protein GUJ93_ZPchr0002g25571 [Zizania palustris]|uniref:Uncharacterized protein n=1 Tax=Zizania palustris TaxID=103762 RepID=A0A8J5VR47_ZIZPA|nr:hypothetical protein GUJ93_ZPchr0002g25571 [Zizania palustris]